VSRSAGAGQRRRRRGGTGLPGARPGGERRTRGGVRRGLEEEERRERKREKRKENGKKEKEEEKEKKKRKMGKRKRKELGKILEKFRGISREIRKGNEEGFCGFFWVFSDTGVNSGMVVMARWTGQCRI
jgi:hypothetical protein